MRILRCILMFMAVLAVIGLIAVNLALASRTPRGPDLGVTSQESGLEDGPVRQARLWYMRNALGRWSEDGRCDTLDDQWLFTRRRVIRSDMECSIRRFVPGDPMEVELDDCTTSRPSQTISLELTKTGRLRVGGDVAVVVDMCQ